MTAPAEEDEFTELVDADFPRVDLVGKGANGIPRFLIAKQDGAAGLLEPGFVRDLIAKAEPAASGRERVTMPSGVTLSGSPADIAAFIHQAAQRGEPDEVAKAKLSSAELNDLPDSAFAYIESGGKKDDQGKTTPRSLRHFAIHDKTHADNAAARIAQGAEFGDKALPKVKAAQRRFGEKVSKEAAVADTVTKDMGPELDDGVDGMDPTIPLAAPGDDSAPGDPADPGSPAWEAVDAATACKWTSILARARVAIDLLGEREMLEAASADPDDIEHAWDLQDVCCAIDYAISVLAPYAVAEQSEADTAAMAQITKAMAGDLSGPLSVAESLGAVRKAGRVLSAANEAAIRGAAESLQKVLASLPPAPSAPDDIAKQEGTTVDAPQTGTETAPDAAEVTKADDGDGGKPAMQAVFDQDGNLVGIVDPAAITPVSGAGKPSGGDAADGAAAAAPPADDTAPQPAAAAGTPADGVAKAAGEDVITTTREVLKSIAADAARTALEAQGAAHQEVIAKMAADSGAVAEELRVVKARLETVEGHPAAPKVFTSGQVPPAGLRGQDQGGGVRIDVAKAREMKQRMYTADPAEANAIHDQLNRSAIASLEAIHAAGRQ